MQLRGKGSTNLHSIFVLSKACLQKVVETGIAPSSCPSSLKFKKELFQLSIGVRFSTTNKANPIQGADVTRIPGCYDSSKDQPTEHRHVSPAETTVANRHVEAPRASPYPDRCWSPVHWPQRRGPALRLRLWALGDGGDRRMTGVNVRNVRFCSFNAMPADWVRPGSGLQWLSIERL